MSKREEVSSREPGFGTAGGQSRRRVLQNIAAAAFVGPVGLEAAQHVHQMASEDVKANAGVYKPKALTQHEFDTLK